MKKRSFYILFLFVLLSCGNDFDTQAYLDQQLNKRVNSFLEKEKGKCLEKAETNAIEYIDSLISQWVNIDLLDSLQFPNRPSKPSQPEPIIQKWKDPSEKKLNKKDSIGSDSLINIFGQ